MCDSHRVHPREAVHMTTELPTNPEQEVVRRPAIVTWRPGLESATPLRIVKAYSTSKTEYFGASHKK